MSPFSIRCFKPGSVAPANSFFILSKGINTGRPSFTPNTNCFVLVCDNPCDLHQFYWLVYALWQANKFHPSLCGSVVLFIHLRDLKRIVCESSASVTDFDKIAETMQKALKLEQHLEEQLKLLRQTKRCILKACLITEK